MKYFAIVFMILVLNLTITLFTQAQVIPINDLNISSLDEVDQYGNIIENNKSMAYSIEKWTNKDRNKYSNAGILNEDQQYLQSGGDFVRSLFYFFEVFVIGTVLIYPTMINIGVPHFMIWFITTIVYFFYIIGLLQLVSNRNLEQMK